MFLLYTNSGSVYLSSLSSVETVEGVGLFWPSLALLPVCKLHRMMLWRRNLFMRCMLHEVIWLCILGQTGSHLVVDLCAFNAVGPQTV